MKDMTVADWLASLADRTPAPGGGAAAALAAATGAALVAMVTGFTTGARYADREARMWEVNAEAGALRAQALDLAALDEQAFGEVAAAYQLPRQSEEDKKRRREAIQRALVGAVRPPVRTGRLAARVVALAAELVDTGNRNVVSDVAAAAAAARAAIEMAIVNIEINRSQIRDAVAVAELGDVIAELSAAVTAADSVTARVREVIAG
jgi:methenyltetrahydrofolate cyclohydrolase